MEFDYIANLLGSLKRLERTGWKNENIPAPETVAAHSFGVVFMTFLLCPEHLDCNKCIKMAVIHDLPEQITGDYTPFDNITTEEKHQNELLAITQIADKLQRPEIKELFIEYEAQKSPEARFVKDIDKLDAVLQAQYYDNQNLTQHPIFSEFLAYASKRFCGGYQSSVISDFYKHILGNKPQNILDNYSQDDNL